MSQSYLVFGFAFGTNIGERARDFAVSRVKRCADGRGKVAPDETAS